VDAPCLVRGTATLTKTHGKVVTHVTGSSGATYQDVSAWDVTLTGHGRIPDETFTVVGDYPLIKGSKVGDTVTVSLWRGQMDTVTNRLGTVRVGVSPIGDLRTLDFMAAFLFVLALGVGWLGRVRPRRPSRPRFARILGRTWLVGIVGGTLLVSAGAFELGLVLTALVALPAFAMYLTPHGCALDR
jgi:hypothetical protein